MITIEDFEARLRASVDAGKLTGAQAALEAEKRRAWLGGNPTAAAIQSASGPGTELKKLLARIGIKATPTCSCNKRAMAMDANESREPGWCEAHLDEIVGWLREEATKRKLPFIDAAGRMLVRRAIRNARKAAS